VAAALEAAVHLQAAVAAVHLQVEIRVHLHLHLLPLLEQEELVAAEERPGMLAAVVKLVVPVQHLHAPLAVPRYA
jgi:hypothetical protein